MAKFHFVEDYEEHVKNLLANYPIDEAMSLAVGGGFEKFGTIELNLLLRAGLKPGMSVFDLGCGSGRLATALGQANMDLRYTGTDVVQALLDYAKTKTPASFVFLNHAVLNIPAEDASVDIACAFSVFTHLLHTESYLYLEDMYRALKPGGRVVFSFLEFAFDGHWHVFDATLTQQRASSTPHLNMFIERDAIKVWAKRLGYQVVEFIGGAERVNGGNALGQSTVILQK